MHACRYTCCSYKEWNIKRKYQLKLGPIVANTVRRIVVYCFSSVSKSFLQNAPARDEEVSDILSLMRLNELESE